MDVFGIHLSFDPADAIEIVRKISIFELLSLIGLLVALVSLVMSMRANIEQAETRSAEFSFRLWDRFRQDDVQVAFLKIEWGEFKYPVESESHNGFVTREEERGTDRLLSLLDDVASMAKRRALKADDIQRWSYIFARVFDNPSIQNYMRFLDQFYRRNAVPLGPHQLAWEWYKKMPRVSGN
jgi:hypothetical protein